MLVTSACFETQSLTLTKIALTRSIALQKMHFILASTARRRLLESVKGPKSWVNSPSKTIDEFPEGDIITPGELYMPNERKQSRHSFQEIRKRVTTKCLFCDETNYDLLDVHRIVPGSDGGKYTTMNTVVVCVKCHRLCHSGAIKIERKYTTTRATPIVHFWQDGEEKWVYEEMRPIP